MDHKISESEWRTRPFRSPCLASRRTQRSFHPSLYLLKAAKSYSKPLKAAKGIPGTPGGRVYRQKPATRSVQPLRPSSSLVKAPQANSQKNYFFRLPLCLRVFIVQTPLLVSNQIQTTQLKNEVRLHTPLCVPQKMEYDYGFSSSRNFKL